MCGDPAPDMSDEVLQHRTPAPHTPRSALLCAEVPYTMPPLKVAELQQRRHPGAEIAAEPGETPPPSPATTPWRAAPPTA